MLVKKNDPVSDESQTEELGLPSCLPSAQLLSSLLTSHAHAPQLVLVTHF